MNSNIGIIGAGELGRALGQAFAHAGVQPLYYDKDETRSTVATIDEIVKNCQVILLCVPSWANKTVAQQIAKAAPPDTSRLVLTFSKGVEHGFVTMDQVLAEHLPQHYNYGLVYGPMLAEEIAAERQGAGVFAGSAPDSYNSVRELFAKAHISLEQASDMHSIAVCGVLKNVYAIAFGMNDGMHLGDNMKGKLVVLVLRELKQMLSTLQLDAQAAEGLAGLGDLLTAGLGEASFNYRVGKTIAEGIAGAKVKSEGLVALQELGRVVDIKHFPVAATLDQTVFHYAPCTRLKDLLGA